MTQYRYARIDMMRLIDLNVLLDWLHTADDCEWREDYQCFFVRIGSPTYTWLSLQYRQIFE